MPQTPGRAFCACDLTACMAENAPTLPRHPQRPGSGRPGHLPRWRSPAKLAGGTGRRRGRTPVRPSGAARVLAKRTTSFQGGNKTLRTFRRDGPGGSCWRKALWAFLWGRPPPRPHTRFFPFHIPRGPPLRRSRPRPALRPEMTRTSCLQAQGKSIPTGRAHRAQVAQPPQGLCGQ